MNYNFTFGIGIVLILISFEFFSAAAQPVQKENSGTVTAGYNETLNLAIGRNDNFEIKEDVRLGTSFYQDNKTFTYLYDKPIGNIIYDDFSYVLKNNEGQTVNEVDYNITILPKPIIGNGENDVSTRVGISFLISFVIVIFIYLLIRRLIRRSNDSESPKGKDRLLDVILEFDWHPSLAFFQFSIWTVIVLVVFLGVYLFNIMSGYIVTDMGSLPANLIIVMGMSTVSSVVSYMISRRNYPKETRKEYPILDMLKENGKISLTRVQMFSWTFIGIAYYIIFLTIMFINTPGSLFKIPDLPQVFIVLMGISQFSYLTGKYFSKTDKLQNVNFFPSTVAQGELFLISCDSIDKKKAEVDHDLFVWFGSKRFQHGDMDGGNHIFREVTSSKIEMFIPKDMEPNDYDLLIEQDSFYGRAENKVTIKPASTADTRISKTK
jgi:hypothetical protein